MAKIVSFLRWRVVVSRKRLNYNDDVMLFGMIAGLASAATSIAGSVKARKAEKKARREQQRLLDRMEADNESDFLRDYYRDAFDDPGARSYLKRISGDLYDRDKAIEGSGISTGATHENVLARKQASNEVMSDAVNNVVVNHEAQRQAARQQYIRRKDAIASGNVQLAQQKGESEAQSWLNLGKIAGQDATVVGSLLDGAGLFSPKAGKGYAQAATAGLAGVTAGSKGYMDDWLRENRQKGLERLDSFR